MEDKNPKTILAVNPGTRQMGLAVLEGSDLVFTSIKTVKVKKMSDSAVLKKLERIILELLTDFSPDVIAVEEPLPVQKKRSPLLNRMFNRVKKIGERENLEVKTYPPPVVRKFICKDEKPTKMQSAFIIATKYYPWLYRYYEKDSAKKWWEEKYWTALFDAVALGLLVLTNGGKEK